MGKRGEGRGREEREVGGRRGMGKGGEGWEGFERGVSHFSCSSAHSGGSSPLPAAHSSQRLVCLLSEREPEEGSMWRE